MTMIDEKAFEAFMLAVHEHGPTGLGYRKALQAYESARTDAGGVDNQYKKQVLGQATITISRQEYESLKRTPPRDDARVLVELIDDLKKCQYALQSFFDDCPEEGWEPMYEPTKRLVIDTLRDIKQALAAYEGRK